MARTLRRTVSAINLGEKIREGWYLDTNIALAVGPEHTRLREIPKCDEERSFSALGDPSSVWEENKASLA